MYLAIIGDLVRSRKLSASERRQVQQKLKSCLLTINRDYADELASDFIITLGDEFQGLLQTPESVLIIIERIRSCLGGYKLRFGLGIGSIYTPIEATSIGADGPAYHAARRALDVIKEQARRSEQPSTSIRLEKEDRDTSLMNSLLAQLHFQEEGWTAKQTQIVWGMREADSQKELAQSLKVSQPYINQVLQATGYYTYRSSQKALTTAIQELFHD